MSMTASTGPRRQAYSHFVLSFSCFKLVMPVGNSNNTSPEVESRIKILCSYGLENRLAITPGSSEKSTSFLVEAFSNAKLSPSNPSPEKAALLFTAVSKLGSGTPLNARNMLFMAIGDSRLVDNPHVEAAAAWLVAQCKSVSNSAVPDSKVKVDADSISIDLAAFEEAAGVGVDVTTADIERAVDNALGECKNELLEKRYRYNVGVVQRGVMKTLRFADGKLVNSTLRAKVEQLLGPKTEADLAKPPKVKKVKTKKPVQEASEVDIPIRDPFEGIPNRFDARGLSSSENTPELIEKHRVATGGKVVCRFPPEPSGYLHIGHAKAMFLDFGYAKKMGGDCVLRFDDTNPAAEKKEYIDSIVEMVHWMGHKPSKITYSSDYFEKLFDLAVELIKRGKAYVCHQNGDEISHDRKEGIESPYRNRSVEDNIRLFNDMRKGKYSEGEATLRMKIDMKSPNLVMRDPVAYRVLHMPHPHVGDKWCIYPSYDYTHCIIDSLEWITHSLCTLEFEIRRDSYYWLLEALDLYRPFVWESARLNMQYTVMSKRKIKQIVDLDGFRGWDDPRMPTLSGMRRRGYSPSALNRFCSAIGVSRGNNVIGMHVLEHWVRADHDANAKRVLAVLRPLKVTIQNFRENEEICVANHPKNEKMGTRSVLLTKVLYIEKTDFRMEDSKGYYGLAPGKSAMLRYAYPIKVIDTVLDKDEVIEVIAEMDYTKSSKPKGVLHWVGNCGLPCEARIYDKLFKSEDPLSLKDEWLNDLSESSEVVIRNGLIEKAVKGSVVGSTFQFERTGYFTVDPDSKDELFVFNMTVSLRDSR